MSSPFLFFPNTPLYSLTVFRKETLEQLALLNYIIQHSESSIDITTKNFYSFLCSVDSYLLGNETSSPSSNNTSSADPGYSFEKNKFVLPLLASGCLLSFVL